ncbi:MAG TPA: MopE-related protein [Myxococcota bacterium]|nr:MopE-related protein [Myxococcota bacterium]
MSDLSRAVFASFLAFAGCDAAPEPSLEGTEDVEDTTPEDVDQDGYAVEDGDCDDLNRAVHPGARERSYDGVDSDCDDEDMPAASEDLYAQGLALLDGDLDGEISFEEFEAACARSAMIVGEARPGVVEAHASCGGTSSCRGMILHPWNELLEHDCRGVNGCTGWSCVETAEGLGLAGAELFEAATCTWCHSAATEGAFGVEVPPGEDVEAWVASFLDRSDAEFRATIAFGSKGVSPNDVAFTNMPAFYERLSRAEIDALIAFVRAMPLEGATFQYGETPEEDE